MSSVDILYQAEPGEDTVARLDSGELAEEPLVEAELRSTIGKSFDRIGAYEESIAMFAHALRLREGEGETHSEETLSLMLDLAAGVRTTNDLERTEKILREIRRRMADRPETFGPEHPLAGRVEHNLAYLLVHRRRHDEAIAPLTQFIDSIEDDELTQELLRSICVDELATLRWAHDAYMSRRRDDQ